MSVSTLALTDGFTDSWTFDWIRFSDGSPIITQSNQPQALVSMGVDNTRLRWNRKDYNPFGVEACFYHETYNDAVTSCDLFRGAVGKLCTLTYTAAGVTYPATMKFFIREGSMAMPRREDSIGGTVYATPSKGAAYFKINLQATGIAYP